MKKLITSAILAGALAAGSAFAADPSADRQTVMGNVGAAMKVAAGFAKGETPFDLVAAQLAVRTMNSASIGFGHMFPEGSETGNKTEASPKIWSDRAGFDAAVAKFTADTSGAEKISDLASFKQAFGGIAANCGACHKAYRVKN